MQIAHAENAIMLLGAVLHQAAKDVAWPTSAADQREAELLFEHLGLDPGEIAARLARRPKTSHFYSVTKGSTPDEPPHQYAVFARRRP